jgi:DNA-binding GntR family transcriptional regulator
MIALLFVHEIVYISIMSPHGTSLTSASGGQSASEIADHLRHRLTNGELVGVAIREAEIAQSLGVSRTPVREAIRILIGEGLLLKERSKSARVFQPSLADLSDIYEIRTPLEALAARRAAKYADQNLVDELSLILDELAEASPGANYSARHEEFHLRLIDAGGSKRLASLVRTLRAQSEPYVRIALQVAPDFRATARVQHRQIVAALQANDGATAERLMKMHLQDSIARVPEILTLQGDPRPHHFAEKTDTAGDDDEPKDDHG